MYLFFPMPAKVSHAHRPCGVCEWGWCGTHPLGRGYVTHAPASEGALAGVLVGHFGEKGTGSAPAWVQKKASVKPAFFCTQKDTSFRTRLIEELDVLCRLAAKYKGVK